MAQRTIYKWQILDFSKTASRDDPTLFLHSKPFTLISTNFKFRLRFEPTNTIEGKSKQYCAVYLFSSDLGEANSVKLDFKLWIENTDGERIVEPEIGMTTDTFNKIEGGWGFYNFVHHDKLYSPASTFIKHDTVFICCAILYKPSIPSDDIPRLATEINEKEWSLYQEGFTGPCTIEVGDQKFKVEKKKLMAHSIVFDRMLKSGMKEAQTGIITLNDVNPTIIQALVKYMHVHKIEDEEVSELYLLADKYEIVDLKEKCSRILINNLDEDNIFDRLIMAFRHNDKVFEQSVLDYLADSPCYFKEIMKSTEWAEFITDNMQLSREIIDEAFKSMSWF